MFVQSWTPSECEAPRRWKSSRDSGQTRTVDSFIRWCAVSTSWVGVLLGVGLLLRRWTGAFDRPLASGMLLLCGLALVAVTWLLRTALAAVSDYDRPRWHHPSWWLPGLALLTMGLAVSMPGTSGLTLFWTLLVIGEAVSWWGTMRYDSREHLWDNVSPKTGVSERRVPNTPLPKGIGPASDWAPTLDDIDQGNIGDDVWQHLTRIREPSGRETLVGLLRGEARAGQQTLPLHVAFCPPFAAVPEVYVQQLEGEEAELRVVEVMTYGVRVDVRFGRQYDSEQRVLVQLMAGAIEDGQASD